MHTPRPGAGYVVRQSVLLTDPYADCMNKTFTK